MCPISFLLIRSQAAYVQMVGKERIELSHMRCKPTALPLSYSPMVDNTGFEPVTFCVSYRCSTTKLIVLNVMFKNNLNFSRVINGHVYFT